MSENLEWVSKADAVETAKLGGVIRERCVANRDVFYVDYKIHSLGSTERVVYLQTKSEDGNSWGGPFSTYIDDNNDPDRWAVIEIGDGTTPLPTVFEFFGELSQGQYVKTSSGTIYMYLGIFYGENSRGEEERQVVLFHPYYNELWFEHDSKENFWETTEYDGKKAADNEYLRLAMKIRDLSHRVQTLDRRLTKVSIENLSLVRDFNTVNSKINEYAENNRMCSEYEERIFSWNEDLTMKLVGRERTWHVYVNVPSVSEYDLSIGVKARSAEQAKDVLAAMSKIEILAELAKQGYKLNIDVEKSTETEPYMS